MKKFRDNFVEKYIKDIKNLLDSMEDDLKQKLDEIANILKKARETRKTVFIMGNGGSASTASHFVGDLSKGTVVKGKQRFKVVGLTDNIPNMLAWANDNCYEDIFLEQLKNLMQKGDVVIGISGSGNSMNVIKAIEYANEDGGITVGLCGHDGGKLFKSAQKKIKVPSFYMQRVEDIHLIIEHILTSLIREESESGSENER